MAEPVTTEKPWSLAGIQGFISHAYKSKFVRNVAVVASGTAGAQAITMAFAPIITRLYGPEAFGILGTFMAIVAVVTPIAALSYPIAIVLPKEDSDARGIARLSAYIALGMATVVAIVLLIFGDRIVDLLQVQEISSYILLIPLVILFAAWLQINQQWLIRKKQFKITARVAVIQAFLINSAKAGMGLFKPLAAVLIVIYTIGQALHAFMLSHGVKKSGASFDTHKTLQKIPLWALAKKHYDFPVYRAPEQLLNHLSQGIPILMLASFFGPASAGFYILCSKLLGIPSVLIGKAVGDVFYPRITEAANQGENITKLIFKATIALVLAGLKPFLIIIIFGPWLFSFIFGEEWISAGEYARWLSIWFFSILFASASVMAIPVISMQGVYLLFTIIKVLTRTIALLVGFLVFSHDVIAIKLLSVSGFVVNIILIIIIIYFSLMFTKKQRKIECFI